MPDARYDIDIDIRKKGNGPEAAEAALEAVGNQAKETATDADQAGDKMDRSLRDTAKEAKKTEGAFEGFGAKIKSAAGVAGAALDKLWHSVKVGAAVATGALVGMVKASVDFNQAIARASTMARNTPFSELSRQVKNLSTDLGIAKSELADGLYQALSAGVSEDNVFSFLTTAGKVAVADGSNIATAVDGITTVLNAFKISSEKTEEVSDLLFKTVANGKTTFADLATNLATVAPTAAASGVGINEVLAAVATLTKQGVPTAQAMTQIRASILSLNDVLGDGWADVDTYQDAIKKIYDEAGGSQTKLRDMAGSVEALAGWLGVAGDNAYQAESDLKAMSEAAGSTEEAFGKMDLFKGWAKLKEELKNWATGIGSAFDSVLQGPVAAITAKLVEWRDDEEIFKKLEDRLWVIHDAIYEIYTYMQQGPEQSKEVWTAVGQLISGYLQKGGELAAQAIAKVAPLLGSAIGNAVKGAFMGDGISRKQVLERMDTYGTPQKDIPLKDFGEVFDRALEELRTEKLKSQGVELAGKVGSGSDATIEAGFGRLKEIAEKGSQELLAADQQLATSAEQLTGSMTEMGQEVGTAADETASIIEESGDDVTQAAEEAGQAVTETANAAEGQLNQASEIVVAATEAATGKIGGGIERLGGAVAQGFDEVSNAVARIVSATEGQINAIAARLQATEAALVANASRTSTLESQVKNMRS